ncbi:MAG TPA: hypothetical protein VHQ93_16365 [Chitinophagaceae bacterium]|jgi:hypothetical protein|nr:hypothetical protein [Chitinophagaceae bacterium]
MPSIDKIDWHSGGNFPDDLPPENGGTHIGMFLTWIIDNDLLGEWHLENSMSSIQAVKSRQMTGRDFLIEECDAKFWDEDLNKEGLEFTKYYYDDEKMNLYINDYEELLGDELETLYHVENSWSNYDRLRKRIDERYLDWKIKISD